MRSAILAVSVLCVSSLAARAGTIVTEQLTGTFQSGSILGGSILVDTSDGVVTGGDPTVTTAGVVANYSSYVSQFPEAGMYYLVYFQDVGTPESLQLVVPGESFSTPSQLCAVDSQSSQCNPYILTSIIDFQGGLDDLVTTGTPISATPEPSSIILLGSGILGAAGVIRRKELRCLPVENR